MYYFYNKEARASKNDDDLIIALLLFLSYQKKLAGARFAGVKLAPGSKIKKATAMHAKVNVALDSSTPVTSSFGA